MSSDVAIVGAGLVGLILAAELRACGVAATVLEREHRPDGRLRAPAITERTIEALERHGLLDEIVRETDRYRSRLGAHPGALRAELRVAGTRALPIRQDLVERVLDGHVRARGGDIRRGHELVDLSAGERGVDLRVRRSDGCEELLSAAWVVGCDGGRSTIRAAGGFAFPGTGPTLTGYQAEVAVAGPGTLRRGWHRGPAGIAAYELCPSRVVSIEFTAPEDRAAPVCLDEVQASLRRTSGTDVTLTDARSLTRFTDNARIADAYRRGRILLAGDAAHVHAPFGGQGLNLGVQDAVNLGWKLAATARGWASPALLDSYEAERRPVAQEVLRTVQAAIALIDPDERMTPAHELFAELRQLDEVQRHLHAKTAMVNLRYATLSAGGNDLVGRAPRGVAIATAGGVIGLTRLARAGRGLLLVLSKTGRPAALVAAPWRDRIDVAFGEPAAAAEDARDGTDLAGIAALLLRPDGHVAWLDRDDDHDGGGALRAALTRWHGRASPLPAAAPRSGPAKRASQVASRA
jgi:2-polyprenyl-6-methoxyphenol hydroxylase-like FAD-dependent oxidoreductase